MKPYYEQDGITIYHGDCRELMPSVSAAVIVMDPPYGISSHRGRSSHANSIVGDEDTTLRDYVMSLWRGPALVFGSWKRPRPKACRMILTWDKGDHVGMGDLSLPWKPNTEEIYVIGNGFVGHRGGSVLRYPAPTSWNSVKHGMTHPHEKPLPLMSALLGKCPPGAVLDPFMGSGTTLLAAKSMNRRAIGVEIEERYCEIAAKRLSQGVLNLEVSA